MVKLLVEPMDNPELWDFLLGSGVVRADESVSDGFLGIIDGDLERDLVSIDTGGGRGMLILVLAGGGGGGGIMDIRFIRRVSVGLIVLAPRPLACAEWAGPGMIEVRLLLTLEAAAVPRALPLTRGERAASDRRLDSTP